MGLIESPADWLDRGIAVIPVLPMSKKPALPGWSNLRLAADDLPQYFADDRLNIGGLWGAPSNNVVDVDLDCSEAVKAAPDILPETGLVWGRPGNPASHWLYRLTTPTQTRKWVDPTRQGDEATVLELRSTGSQSVLPPSTHPSGERYELVRDGDPREIEADELVEHLDRLFAMALMIQNWPDGARHDAALAFAGGALGDGHSVEDVEHWIRVIGKHAGDAEADDRVRAVQDTAGRMARGEQVIAWGRLKEIIDRAVVNKVRKHLGADPTDLSTVAGDRQPIDVTGLDLMPTCRLAWEAVVTRNDPPKVFRKGSSVATLGRDADGNLATFTASRARLRTILGQMAYWYRQSGQGRRPVPPPDVVVESMLVGPDERLPILDRVTRVPVLTLDGRLHMEPGYDPVSRVYYDPAPGVEIPPVSVEPSSDEIERARRLVVEELLGDFRFAGDERGSGNPEVAHSVALFLAPYVRTRVSGPTPSTNIDGTGPGAGKTLLSQALLWPATAGPPSTTTEARDDDEWRKRITSALIRGRPVVILDNVTRPLDSGVLAAALTTPSWEDRLLGHNELVSLPVSCTWVVTGNNLVVSTEIARRSVRIRLDPRQDRPWQRTGFKHSNLREWVDEHQGDLIWAALTMIRAWLAAGSPVGTKSLGSYEQWSGVIGGILDVVGIKGFLGNLDDFYDSSDTEGTAWRALIDFWWEKFGRKDVGAGDLYDLAESKGLDFGLRASSDRGRMTAFGLKLKQRRDQVIEGYQVVAAGIKQRSARWRLVRVTNEARSEPREPSEPFSSKSDAGFSVLHVDEADGDTGQGTSAGDPSVVHQGSQGSPSDAPTSSEDWVPPSTLRFEDMVTRDLIE